MSSSEEEPYDVKLNCPWQEVGLEATEHPTKRSAGKGKSDERGKVHQDGPQQSTQAGCKAAQDSQVAGHPGGRRWSTLPYLQAGKGGQIEIRDSLPHPSPFFS